MSFHWKPFPRKMTQSKTIILAVWNRENKCYYFSMRIFELPSAEFSSGLTAHCVRFLRLQRKIVRHLQNRPGSIASDYLESIRLHGTFSLSFQCLRKSSEKCLEKPTDGSVSKPQISGTMLLLALEREKKEGSSAEI